MTSVRLAMALPLTAWLALEATAQLPPRQPIFLNNNASLYTFPNPNFGLPSQLPYAFVAVAHEDCRLFNNGAKLMPQHRLMAAECMQNAMNGGGGGGGVPGGGPGINPFNPYFNPGWQIGGIPYRRAYRPAPPWLASGYGYGGSPHDYANAGYGSYPMLPEPVLTTAQGLSPSDRDPVSTPRKSYQGFGRFREHAPGGFSVMVQSDPTRGFGKGFDATARDDEPERPRDRER